MTFCWIFFTTENRDAVLGSTVHQSAEACLKQCRFCNQVVSNSTFSVVIFVSLRSASEMIAEEHVLTPRLKQTRFQRNGVELPCEPGPWTRTYIDDHLHLGGVEQVHEPLQRMVRVSD